MGLQYTCSVNKSRHLLLQASTFFFFLDIINSVLKIIKFLNSSKTLKMQSHLTLPLVLLSWTKWQHSSETRELGFHTKTTKPLFSSCVVTQTQNN